MRMNAKLRRILIVHAAEVLYICWHKIAFGSSDAFGVIFGGGNEVCACAVCASTTWTNRDKWQYGMFFVLFAVALFFLLNVIHGVVSLWASPVARTAIKSCIIQHLQGVRNWRNWKWAFGLWNCVPRTDHAYCGGSCYIVCFFSFLSSLDLCIYFVESGIRG